MIERQAVIDNVIGAHAKGKIPKSSNSVIAVTEKQRFSDKSQAKALKKVFSLLVLEENIPTVNHNGGLGQSCGPRGVNIK